MLPVVHTQRIRAMTVQELDNVRQAENILRALPQVRVTTEHILHAGLYSRTIKIPPGVVITGALVKIPTLLIISGDALIYTGGETLHVCGCQAIPASAGTKRAFLAHTETTLTMVFTTTATTVEQAEAEFTDDVDLLISHDNENVVIITGE